jgi:hypothetical protein
MSEKMPESYFDKEGRIVDPNVAEEMAHIEDKYHDKTMGIFPPSEAKIKRGEQAAEKYIMEKGVPVKFSHEVPNDVWEVIVRELVRHWSIDDAGDLEIKDIRRIDKGNGEEEYIVNGDVAKRRTDEHKNEHTSTLPYIGHIKLKNSKFIGSDIQEG